MSLQMSIPFLDCVGTKDEHGGKRKASVRPWQSYWPPEEDSELSELLRSTVPEVLSWRFNPDDPFDRPWQSWSKNNILSGKVCTSKVLPPQELSSLSDHGHQTGVSAPHEKTPEHRDSCQDRMSGTRAIDETIRALGLVDVIPDQLNYLAPDALYDAVKPFHTRLPFMGSIQRSNIVAQGYSNMRVFDVSGHEDKFTLDTNGFQYVPMPHGISQWTDSMVRERYLPEMKTWLKKFFDCQEVFIYTYNFRCADRDRTSTESWVSPYMRAHCDVTKNSGLRRLDLHLPNDAEKIKLGKYKFVGIWRPLTEPYQDRPLALLDHRSICEEDLVGADVVFPHYCDEGYEVLHSPHHRWFYKRGMSINEVLMFKLYDSSPGEVCFCPHTAFIDPSAPIGTPPRASIEMRAIIIQ